MNMDKKKTNIVLDPSKTFLSEESLLPRNVQPEWHLLTAFSSLCILALMVSLDATSLPVALPVLSKDLGGSAVEALWSATSFLLASTVFQPVIGSFSHLFGRKHLLNISLVLFFIGSIVIAAAKNITTVIIGRAVQGSGGGGILCLTTLIVVDRVPLRERGKWISLLAAVFSIGTVTGPLFGGGLAKQTQWRWIFWINVPLLGIATALIALFLDTEKKPGSFIGKLQAVDWVGIALFLPSATGFLIPITRGGVDSPWDSLRTLVPLFVSAAGLIVFAIHQEYLSSNPLICTFIFKNLSTSIILFQSIIYGIILGTVFLYLPMYFEAVKGMSPVMAGVAILPWTLTVAPCAMVSLDFKPRERYGQGTDSIQITGIAISKTAKYRWANWLGWCSTVLGISLLVLLKSDTPTGIWVMLCLIGGVGLGIIYPSMLIAVQASSTTENQTQATNLLTFFRAFGQAMGVAVGGAVFQNMMERIMFAKPLLANVAKQYSRDAVELVQIIKAMPETEMKKELRESFASALMWTWVSVAVLSGLGLVSSLFLKGYDLSSPEEAEQINADKKQ